MDNPVLPDYAGGCISNIVPALLDGVLEDGSSPGSWMPPAALEADQVVLLVLDGLGWDQLTERRHIAPTLSSMIGGPP